MRSETSPSACCNPVTSQQFTGTIGVPLPSTWMKCIDDEGREVPDGEVGELACRGPYTLRGYFGVPDYNALVRVVRL